MAPATFVRPSLVALVLTVAALGALSLPGGALLLLVPQLRERAVTAPLLNATRAAAAAASAAACTCAQCLLPSVAPLDLFSIYLSQPGDVARGLRSALRHTSLSLINSSQFAVGYCFMLSPPEAGNATEHALLAAEQAAHSDVLFFDAAIATRDLARKVHQALGNFSRLPQPPPRFLAKLDDDSMLRYDHALPELRAQPSTVRLYWGRNAWSTTYLSNYIMSSEVAATLSTLPIPEDCFYNEDECMGRLADATGLVTQWQNDERWIIKGPDAGWSAELCPWCAVWPGPQDDQDTICAHHVYEQDMRKWWGSRGGGSKR